MIIELSHETQWYRFPAMVCGTISAQSDLREIHWIRREIHQGPVEIRESEEDMPKLI